MSVFHISISSGFKIGIIWNLLSANRLTRSASGILTMIANPDNIQYCSVIQLEKTILDFCFFVKYNKYIIINVR